MPAPRAVAVPHGRIDTDQLRAEHPIADLIACYGIELRRSGSTLVGRCPFHADKGRPNLAVYPALASLCAPMSGARGCDRLRPANRATLIS